MAKMDEATRKRVRAGRLMLVAKVKAVGVALLQGALAHGFGTELWTLSVYA